eukprot:scaffold1669_cov129-Cylindrotheca_fusiformis.AAC.52
MLSSLCLRGGGIRRVLVATKMNTSLDRTKAASHLWSCRQFSTDETKSSGGGYAVVDHSEAYEAAMQGPHGEQLALARLEGKGKDDPPFDPFLEEELAALEVDGPYDDEDGNIIQAQQDDDDDDDEEEEEDDFSSPYNRDGSIRRSKSVLATLRAGFPAGGQFAVVELGGAQHKVTTDDLVVVNRLKPVEKYKIGSVHTLTDVMLVASSHKTLVGMPYVKGAEVDVMVEEITRDGKVIIFKKRRRKNSQRRNGFRRDVTLLRVLDIRFPESEKEHYHVGRDILEELDEDRTELQSRTA